MPHNSFTLFGPGILRSLVTDISISVAFDPRDLPKIVPAYHPFKAVWDTGATGSVISKNVVDTCGLKPITKTNVSTAGGMQVCDVFLVNCMLPNQVGFAGVTVTQANMGQTDVLIGMDIISMGDFALTHKEGKTCFSFRVPSVIKIDFVETSKLATEGKIDPYQPCLCGSGKKFKFCCKSII